MTNEDADAPFYLLDTSAVRAISRVRLDQAVAMRRCAVSTVTFWEMLCHLDEQPFERAKPQLAKMACLELLDEPFASHARLVGASGDVNPTRFEERGIVRRLLDLLKEADSFEQFMSSKVHYADGQQGSVEGAAERARMTLDADEKRFVAHLTTLAENLVEDFPNVRESGLSDAEFLGAAVASSSVLTRRYRDESKVDVEDLPARVFASLYLHASYVIHRAERFLMQTGTATFDQNDTEDAYICLHMGLLDSVTLVTNDDGTASAISRALSLVRAALNDAPRPRVITSADFLRELGLEGRLPVTM